MKGSGWRCERSAAIDETFAAPSANHQTIVGQSRTAGTKHAQQRGPAETREPYSPDFDAA